MNSAVAAAPPASHSAGLYRAAMFDAGAWLARMGPLATLRALAGATGWIYARTHPARVAVVEENLRLLDAALPPSSARGVYSAFAQTLADYFHIGTRPPEEAVKIITRIDGEEHLRAAHQLGRGVLIVTAHFGLFELGGLLLAQRGYPAVVLTYPDGQTLSTTVQDNFFWIDNTPTTTRTIKPSLPPVSLSQLPAVEWLGANGAPIGPPLSN